MRPHLRRVRNIAISFVVLLVLIIFGGVGYTWYVGRDQVVVENQVTGEATQKNNSLPEPTKPAENAKVGISIQSLTPKAKPGDNVSMSIRTKAGALCTIAVTYNEKDKSTSVGLVEQAADEYGMVQWRWIIDGYAPSGKWPVEVTCRDSIGQSAYMKGELTVMR